MAFAAVRASPLSFKISRYATELYSAWLACLVVAKVNAALARADLEFFPGGGRVKRKNSWQFWCF